MLTGWKTFIVGALVAVGPSALSYLAGVDWTKIGLTTNVATAITGILMIGLRAITTTPPGKAS